jgi:hypothetical protein
MGSGVENLAETVENPSVAVEIEPLFPAFARYSRCCGTFGPGLPH